MGRKQNEPTGRYAKAALLLRAATEGRFSRKELGGHLKVEGGERTVAHWMSGDTWPRDIEVRRRMRELLGEDVVQEIESEVARVLGLPHVSAQERRVLSAMRHPVGRKRIEKALEEWEKSR